MDRARAEDHRSRQTAGLQRLRQRHARPGNDVPSKSAEQESMTGSDLVSRLLRFDSRIGSTILEQPTASEIQHGRQGVIVYRSHTSSSLTLSDDQIHSAADPDGNPATFSYHGATPYAPYDVA